MFWPINIIKLAGFSMLNHGSRKTRQLDSRKVVGRQHWKGSSFLFYFEVERFQLLDKTKPRSRKRSFSKVILGKFKKKR